MDITTSKNIAFAIFTFFPLVICALFATLGSWVISLFGAKAPNYRHIWRSCWRSILAQAGLIMLVFLLAFMGLMAIPMYGGGLLVLFGSTLLAMVYFIYLVLQAGGKNA